VVDNKRMLIEKLTGIHSSKKTYYVELKKRIEETAKRNTQLEIINQIAKGINIDMSFDQMMESVTDKLRRLVSFDRLSLSILEDGKLVVKSSIPADDPLEGTGREIPPGASAFWTVVTSRKSLLRRDIPDEGNTFDDDVHLGSLGIRSAVLAPLLAKNRVIGIFSLESKKRLAYSNADAVFVEQLADQLAVWVENARLYGEVVRRESEWEETFAAVTDLLLLVDTDYNVVRFNRAVPAFFDRSPTGIAGQKCYSLHNRSCRCDPCPVSEAMRTGKRAFHEIRLPSGRVLDVFAYPVYNEKRELYGAVEYAKDVTQLVQSVKFVALGEMAAGVAHELNSPLTAIVGDAQLLLRDVEDEQQRELLDDVRNCGLRCKRIIQNLLAFSRREEYTFEPTDLNESVERALSLVSYQIDKSNIDIATDLSADVPPVMANSQRIEQVLVNLFLNAKDALENAEGERRMEIRTRVREDGAVTASVSDTGTGIDPQHVDHIFNPFFTTKKQGRGTGLGLSVSLGIVEAHGGTIEVRTEPGVGSTFTVVLPVSQAGGEDRPDEAEGGEGDGGGRGQAQSAGR